MCAARFGPTRFVCSGRLWVPALMPGAGIVSGDRRGTRAGRFGTRLSVLTPLGLVAIIRPPPLAQRRYAPAVVYRSVPRGMSGAIDGASGSGRDHVLNHGRSTEPAAACHYQSSSPFLISCERPSRVRRLPRRAGRSARVSTSLGGAMAPRWPCKATFEERACQPPPPGLLRNHEPFALASRNAPSRLRPYGATALGRLAGPPMGRRAMARCRSGLGNRGL